MEGFPFFAVFIIPPIVSLILVSLTVEAVKKIIRLSSCAVSRGNKYQSTDKKGK